MRGVLLATPFAAEDLQSADLAHWHSAASGGSLHEFLPGARCAVRCSAWTPLLSRASPRCSAALRAASTCST